MRVSPFLLPLALLAACADGPEGLEASSAAACGDPPAQASDINPYRSLAIADRSVLGASRGPLGLEAMLTQLVRQANPSLTDATAAPVALELYQQWWGTLDVANGDTARPHCDNVDPRAIAGNTGPSFNGFMWQCPRDERYVGTHAPDYLTPVGVFYRPDLTPINAANCGEARIIYAHEGTDFAILEAKIPNPTPGCTLGCRHVAQFWANFSTERVNGAPLDAATIQSRLLDFFVRGTAIAGLGPVMHINNLAGASSGAYASGSGQVRIHSLGVWGPWEYREFAVKRLTTTAARRIELRPTTVKQNPSPLLFGDLPTGSDARSVDLRARMQTFRTQFINNDVERLAFGDVTTITMTTANTANTGASRALNGDFDNPLTDYRASAGPELRALIESRLTALRQRAVNPLPNNGLSAQDVLTRATALTCGGCHANVSGAAMGPNLSGTPRTVPSALAFMHVSSSASQGIDIDGAVGMGTANRISAGLHQVYLPARANALVTLLNANRCTTCPAPSPSPSGSPSAFASSGSGLAAASASPSPTPSPAPSTLPGPLPWSETIGGGTVH